MKKNYMRYLLLNSIFFLAIIIPSFAQESHCGTTEATKELYLQHPDLIKKEAEYNAALQQKIANKAQQRSASSDQVYIIPVVFHIIHINGDENIPDENIQDEIDILNRDYRKLNTTEINLIKTKTPNTPFDTLASDIRIEFRLAQLDPHGNCTNGIDRIYSPLTNFANDRAKLNQWPREKYLNVWVVRSIGTDGKVAGYAYFPSSVSTYLAAYDGVLILYNYIGSKAPSSPSTSRALTHEIGHYLSLFHPWGSTNSPEVDCSGSDLVDDTPTTRGHLSCDLLTPFCTLYTLPNANYSFANVTTSSGNIDPTPVPINDGVKFTAFDAVGTSANSSSNGSFAFSGWDTGGEIINHDSTYSLLTGNINASKYYEVTVTPNYKNSMTLTKMTFTFNRDTAGVRTFAVKSSLDGFSNNLAASVSPASKLLNVQPGNVFFSKYDTTAVQNGATITLTGFKNITQPVTFRIYGWNAESAAGTFGIDSVSITGTSGVIENTQNYMDYSYCSVMFTKGQKDRMRATLESDLSGRNNLWASYNLDATGVNGNGTICTPTADFYTTKNLVCTNEVVYFKSNVLNADPKSPATLAWEFEGGSPATSSAANPSVTYTTPGYHNVKLTATTATGSNTTTKVWYVYVRDAAGEFFIGGGVTEGFEDHDTYHFVWHPQDLDNNGYGWQWADVGFNSSHSARMNGYKNFQSDVDLLTSPSYSMFGLKNLKLSFRCAAATLGSMASEFDDVLTVYYSINCGANWSTALTLKGAALINNGYHAEYFVPTSDAQWANCEANIPVINSNNKVIFKFEYVTGTKSNNIYVDNINLTGTVGIDESVVEGTTVDIYPNPTKESTTIRYHLNQRAGVVVELSDILGKQLTKIDQHEQSEGDHTVLLSKEQLNLKSGVYFIKLTIGKAVITRKLIITE
jgi:PKD repeat protein